jgi:hypothetical protein
MFHFLALYDAPKLPQTYYTIDGLYLATQLRAARGREKSYVP